MDYTYRFLIHISRHPLCVYLYLFEAPQYFYIHTPQYRLLGILASLRIHWVIFLIL